MQWTQNPSMLESARTEHLTLKRVALQETQQKKKKQIFWAYKDKKLETMSYDTWPRHRRNSYLQQLR